ncbi:iron (metal) dependent repressor, DtxR family [Tissierella praeacuta DSM 18095]|uniref:Iron (Metal) dependent repressor, DtxR family n=1 Tax=Tissierella praeacuta DSM 18095 TaxID=1123404 RepID=A0A1M4YG84_9FIRM|nr:metal-dependent transcriptional regulator [Tissierella praeacuta]TCU66439.1 DtxR family iron (metal) dependent repressor [Tissierella praeacuta]SHF04678.1 iron (metal) dependent repressor, DtxR family [Tissierella praeacuta DSM 18095]SUP02054.1 Tox regulatory factor [Tissierella praeacuta]
MYESGEMYLETILILSKRNGQVRSIDIARELDYSKPSVSRAMGNLKEDGYILVDHNGYIELTDKGRTKAKDIYEKHKVLTTFLTDIIKVTPEIGEEDACRIEHVISDETFIKLKRFLEDYK